MNANMLSMNNDLINLVVKHEVSIDAWRMVEHNFQSRHPIWVLPLTNQLHTLYMYEVNLVEDYIKKMCGIKNKLITIRKSIFDKNLV